MNKIDAIIFDLDGTMWDSTGAIITPWNDVFEKYKLGYTLTEEDLQKIMGMVLKDIGHVLLPHIEPEKRIQILHECCDNENKYLLKHGGILYPGLEDTLKALKTQYPLFIVSNCEQGYIEAFMKAHHLESYFTDFENTGRTGLLKGDNIKLLIKRNHLKNPVYVGDTNHDFEACQFADVSFIFAAYGFGEVSGYKATINHLSELPKIIDKMQFEK